MSNMTLSEELRWRGFINQTTYPEVTALDGEPITFYLGVDPSAASMQIGNLAVMMMIRHFIDHGHNAVLLVGGATGMIGDPDGKAEERSLKSLEEIAKNKAGIAAQYNLILGDDKFTLVDNYDWFKDMGFLQFLRDVGKHVPMRQMLGRDFVQTRLGEDGAGISYAEFSYVLIQAYDFLYMNKNMGVNLQLCGSDQWGNSIAGVDLVRRINGSEVHVWSAPLVVNKTTGVKFGKTEGGAVWLDPDLTSPYNFYQFWINVDDKGVEDYLKIYTLLTKEEIEHIITEFKSKPSERLAQKRLAYAVTALIHGDKQADLQWHVADALAGQVSSHLSRSERDELKRHIPHVLVEPNASIILTLVKTGLASSNTEARKLLDSGAIYISGKKVTRENFEVNDFMPTELMLRRGKAYKDTALIELA